MTKNKRKEAGLAQFLKINLQELLRLGVGLTILIDVVDDDFRDVFADLRRRRRRRRRQRGRNPVLKCVVLVNKDTNYIEHKSI